MFIMPKINLKEIDYDYDYTIMKNLVDARGYLLVKPHSQSTDAAKYFHYVVLCFLYSRKEWKTPYPGSWYMPHILVDDIWDFYFDIFYKHVEYLFDCGVFEQGNCYE
jgi:hypothetical protein